MMLNHELGLICLDSFILFKDMYSCFLLKCVLISPEIEVIARVLGEVFFMCHFLLYKKQGWLR